MRDDECPYARRILEIGRGEAFDEVERNELQEHLRGACAGCAVVKRDPTRNPVYDHGRMALVGNVSPADGDVEQLVRRISSHPPPPPDVTDELFRRTYEAIARKKGGT